MPIAVINARTTEAGRAPSVLRLKRIHLDQALEAIDSCVLLFAPRDDRSVGYYGHAILNAIVSDLDDHAFMLIQLDDFRPFPASAPTASPRGAFEAAARDADGALKWWTYSAGIRFITDNEFNEIVEAAGSFGQAGFSEAQPNLLETFDPHLRELEQSRQRKRDAHLRLDVLPHYGARCALTGHRFSLSDAEEVEVCHLRALQYGGSDDIRNTMPMGRTVHWCFDKGLVSLQNDGTILFSSTASGELRARFPIRRALFPRDPRSGRIRMPWSSTRATCLNAKLRCGFPCIGGSGRCGLRGLGGSLGQDGGCEQGQHDCDDDDEAHEAGAFGCWIG